MRNLIMLGAAAIALGACSDGGSADTDGDGKISNEEVAAEMNKVKLKPGQWKNTLEVIDLELDGLPEGAPPNMEEMIQQQMKNQMAQTSTSCITPEQAENPGADFFAAQEQTNCEVSKFDMSGGEVESVMSCDMGGAGKMDMEMDGEYSSSNYAMTMNMNAQAQGMTIKMKVKNNGEYVGACPESEG